MKKFKKALQWFFTDKHGHVIIAQLPNPPLLVAIAGFIGAHLLRGSAARWSYLIESAGLLVWAWLELYAGDSYFRRLLGFVVLVSMLATVLA